jgi:hypothetical protein
MFPRIIVTRPSLQDLGSQKESELDVETTEENTLIVHRWFTMISCFFLVPMGLVIVVLTGPPTGVHCLISAPPCTQRKAGAGHGRHSASTPEGNIAVGTTIRSRCPLASQIATSNEDKACSLLKFTFRLSKLAPAAIVIEHVLFERPFVDDIFTFSFVWKNEGCSFLIGE